MEELGQYFTKAKKELEALERAKAEAVKALERTKSETVDAMNTIRKKNDEEIALMLENMQRIKETERNKIMAEISKLQKEKLQLDTNLVTFDEIVNINVGGGIFSTRLSTLRSEKDSMLAAMFSGRHNIAKDKLGNYFIDRSAKTFEPILDYLRTGEVPTNITHKEAMLIKQEANYYGISSLVKLLDRRAEPLCVGIDFTVCPKKPVYNNYMVSGRVYNQYGVSEQEHDKTVYDFKWSQGSQTPIELPSQASIIEVINLMEKEKWKLKFSIAGVGLDYTGVQNPSHLVFSQE